MLVHLRKLKHRLKNSVYLSLILLFVALGLGCSSTHKTTTTETIVTYPNGGDPKTTTAVSTAGDQQNRGVIEKSETSTTTTETKSDNPGILSSTLHAVGYVIALPFIIVGGLLRIIFGG